MSAQQYLDAILIPLGLGMLLAYHAYLLYVIRRHPLRTVVGANNVNRRAWVRSIMKDQSKCGVLAAQTLRNSIMGSTLLSTTSITLASALAAFLGTSVSATLEERVNAIVVGSTSGAVLMLKFFVVVVCFLMAFLCYVQAIRYTNHVIFIITIPIEDVPELTPDYVAGVLARGSNFQTLGNRIHYFALPLIFWIFGPIPMIVCVFISIPMMWRADFSTDFLIEVEGEAAKKEGGVEGDVESQRVDYDVGGFGGERDDGETKRRGLTNGAQDAD